MSPATPSPAAVLTEATRPGVEREILAIVGELVGELGGATVTPSLDDSLERDLGISSLERVELLLRLERAFGVRLTVAVMAEAITLNDLVTAVLRAEPRVAEPLPLRREPPSPGQPAPRRQTRSSRSCPGMRNGHRIACTSTFGRIPTARCRFDTES